jgi:molecular chaperone GrpE (heat shock protein)
VSTLRRKITFQLVPLLDLMLIVVFAQFMEMRQSAERQAERANVAVEEGESAKQARRDDVEKLERVSAEQLRLTSDNERLSAELDKGRIEAEAALRQARSERDRIASLMSELLDIPEAALDRALAAGTPEQKAGVKRFLSNLPGEGTADLVRQVLTIDQLQKSCDIWKVRIDDSSIARLSCGRDAESFRADTPAEFEKKFFDWYKSLPPPKSIVIIQLSWSDATAEAREAARLGIIPTVDRMRADRNGRTVFEYVVLGFTPAEKP